MSFWEAPDLIEHEELEREAHDCVRVAIPEQLPVKHIALLQKQKRERYNLNYEHTKL